MWLRPGCILQAAAVNMPMMIVGRLIAGFAMGALTSLATLYQAEISPTHVRGMMTASTKFVNNWGFFTSNWIGYGCEPLTTSAQWRIPLAIQIIPPIILGVGMIFMPESPRFLISRGHTERARIVLKKLRSKREDMAAAVEAELEEMKVQIDWEHENLTSRWVDLFNTRPNLRRTGVAVMVQGMAVFNGIVVMCVLQDSDVAVVLIHKQLLRADNLHLPWLLGTSPLVLVEKFADLQGQKVLLINGLWGLCGPIASFIYMVYGGMSSPPHPADAQPSTSGAVGR